MKPIRYSIWDPTGNITALVESAVEPSERADIASALMQCFPEAEQVGFVCFDDPGEPRLDMTGGEFCGNASMCAAALYLLRGKPQSDRVRISVSGTSKPVTVSLNQTSDGSFDAAVSMPPAKSIERLDFTFAERSETLPVVRMEGVDHIIIRSSSPFFTLLEDRNSAEKAVREWRRQLASPCLGLMFVDEQSGGTALTPLVYVPGSQTIFWENSCASGTAAAGMVFAEEKGQPVEMPLREPGGVLRVKSDPLSGETLLYGSCRLRSEGSL